MTKDTTPEVIFAIILLIIGFIVGNAVGFEYGRAVGQRDEIIRQEKIEQITKKEGN